MRTHALLSILVGVAFAVTAWAQTPIPQLAAWEGNMLVQGARFCNEADINAAIGKGGVVTEGNVWYYDGARVYDQMAAYTGDPSWYTCAGYVNRAYRAWVLAVTAGVKQPIGALNAWRIFPHGLLNDYRRTGDANSREAVIRLAQYSPFAGSGGGPGCDLSRETAYVINAYLAAEEAGQPRNPHLATAVNYALGYIDQWFVSKTCRNLTPFTVGLTMEALIGYYEKTGDARIPAQIRLAADGLWSTAWVPANSSFYYESAGDKTAGTPDLNLLIAPAYAWLWHQTGAAEYLQRGDQVFAGGVLGANFWSGKQFSQNYRWSFDYVKWRSANGSPPASGAEKPSGPLVKPITSFEQGNPFDGGVVVAAHATDGAKALRIDKAYAAMSAAQNWAGYDYLKVDTYVEGTRPVPVTVEIRDTETTGYWTRVNYDTVAPPGASTLILAFRQLYVGEKARPGRYLNLGGITRLVFAVGDAGPLFLDNLRLERDTAARSVFFDGLYAFDFGTATSPVMDGFTQITPDSVYFPRRGYGLKNAKVWRAFDALQPDPLYQDFICIESGGLAVDVPNGKYRVFVNMDSPSAYWGDYQVYRERSILAQGKTAISERMDFKAFQKKYFRFWDTEDLPSDNTFDKYQRAYFSEKVFDVDVKNGQLYIEFQGETWACSVSAVIVFPVEKAAEGARFLDYVKEKRRFYFDNAFKRVLHNPEGDPLQPAAEDTGRGYVVFQRDFMKDVYYNDTPYRAETGQPLVAGGFAGETVPVTMSVLPLKDLRKATLSVSALAGPQGSIAASAIDVGYVSYRLTRVTMDGAVYTISPRLIVPKNTVALPKGVARRFWLTVHVPAGAAPGVYTGQLTFTPQQGAARPVPLRFTVRKGTLDAVDIPVGPWGGRVGTPWFADDPATTSFGAEMTEKSLLMLRAHGFTMFSGVPYVSYQGFKDGKPALDFSIADRQMADARRYGFRAVDSYGAGVIGIDAYHRDLGKMKEAGFTDYSAFVKAIYSAIDRHARDKEWLPVYWNLGDEPNGDDLKASIENARAYRQAFPKAPPFFTAATSLPQHAANDPHFELAKTLHVATLNGHDEASLKLLASAGGAWAYYNGGSRWTYGMYLYKAVQEFGLKFRLAWHWNSVAGDPYYALDCREDDYAWANATPDRQLVPSVEFMRISAGLDDYRHLLTLARLAKAKEGTPAAKQAEALIRNRMAAFHLGQVDHDALFGVDDWAACRRQLADAIETLE